VGWRDPLVQFVWPLWTGAIQPPEWRSGERFTGNLISVLVPGWIDRLPANRQWVQFLPLLLAQVVAFCGVWRFAADPRNGHEAHRGIP
jgi:hypothetical protein